MSLGFSFSHLSYPFNFRETILLPKISPVPSSLSFYQAVIMSYLVSLSGSQIWLPKSSCWCQSALFKIKICYYVSLKILHWLPRICRRKSQIPTIECQCLPASCLPCTNSDLFVVPPLHDVSSLLPAFLQFPLCLACLISYPRGSNSGSPSSKKIPPTSPRLGLHLC